MPDSGQADSTRSVATDTTSAGTGALQKDSAGVSTNTPQNAGAPDTLAAFTGYRDSIAKWVDAQVKGNLFEYLSLYDSSLFKSDKGGFADFRDNAIGTILPNENNKNNLTLDSIWQEKTTASTSRVCAIVNDKVKSRRTRYDLIWNLGNSGWRIVRQREEMVK